MAKVDFEQKAKVLNTDLCKKVRKYDKIDNFNCNEGVVKDSYLDEMYFSMLLDYGFDYIKEARRINHCSDNRTWRLRKKIRKLVESGKSLFLTLTFRDSVLDSTSIETRRKYVVRFLASLGSRGYVANIDYGNKTEREHYHAVIGLEHLDCNLWPYGFSKIKRVRLNGFEESKTMMKLPRYINKLTNHAIKETAKGCRIIYSRDKNHTIK